MKTHSNTKLPARKPSRASCLRSLFSAMLFAAGLGLLALTNAGVLSSREAYIYTLSRQLPAREPAVAFLHANLVPMDTERVVADQTVIVRDGAIAAIAPTGQVPVPEDALVIDASGKYLIPGLVDMHVHIMFENDLLLLVANGVTGVRNMWGNTGRNLRLGMPDQLALRRQIQQGDLLGPAIYTTGPVMEGEPAFHPLAEAYTIPGQASAAVAWQAAQGYDFVKVYDHLSPQVYDAILRSAGEHGLPVVGHVPLAIGIDRALASGQQTIEHLSGYVDPDAVRLLIPEDELDAYAEQTRLAGVWNCVTLSEYPKSLQTPAGFEQLQNQPGMRYISPGWRLISPFFYRMAAQSHTYAGDDYPERVAALNRTVLNALHAAGAGILVGTDSAQPYHIPGFAVHEELALLVEAGLSPYEALEAATRNPALAMRLSSEFGTLEIGKRADMLLLDANPLEDVAHVQRRAGVVLRGRWLSEEHLQTMLNALAASYRPHLVDYVWPFLLLGAALILIRKVPAAREEAS